MDVKTLSEALRKLDSHNFKPGDSVSASIINHPKVLKEAINTNYDYQDDNFLRNLHPLNNDFYSGDPAKFAEAAQKATGYDSVKVNFDDGQHIIPWQPNQIRSRFAAFDPLRKDSADLLASYLLPATMLGFGMANQEQDPLAEALRNGY